MDQKWERKVEGPFLGPLTPQGDLREGRAESGGVRQEGDRQRGGESGGERVG